MLPQEPSFGHVMKKQFPKTWYIESYSALASGDQQSNKEEQLRPISVLIENSDKTDWRFCLKSDQINLIAATKIKVSPYVHNLR